MAERRLKVYGLLWLTRRAYLTIQAAGLIVGSCAIAMVARRERPKPIEGEPLPPLVASLDSFFDWLPWIVLLVLLLAGIETYVVLRKFRKLEEQQASLS
jgi:hypothetical protein